MNNHFKDIMSQIPTCTAVILCKDKIKNEIVGCTISSLISLSVLEGEEKLAFVLKINSRTGEILSQNQNFTVSVLSNDQSDLAKAWGGQWINFDLANYLAPQIQIIDESKLQLINEKINFYLCVETIINVQTSNIFICKVIESKINNDIESTPLIYQNRTFGFFCENLS